MNKRLRQTGLAAVLGTLVLMAACGDRPEGPLPGAAESPPAPAGMENPAASPAGAPAPAQALPPAPGQKPPCKSGAASCEDWERMWPE